jgi:serine-type D-Ala-D-Ala carboxypeptidase/endopeptidase (penicillin-binding protein 4)
MKQTIISCFLLFIVLSSCQISKQARTSKSVCRNLQNFNRAKHFVSGLSVFNPETNKFLVQYNDSQYFTPASNTKILTFLSTLSLLKDSVPAIKFAVKNDTLFFTGTGDPTFLDPDFNSDKVISFFQKAKFPLVYQPSLLTSNFWGPGWGWDDFGEEYAPERASFPIYANLVTVKLGEHNSPVILPKYFSDKWEKGKTLSKQSIERQKDQNRFVYNPYADSVRSMAKIPFIYSDSVFVKLLSREINKPIALTNKPSAQSWQTLYNTPTDSMLRKMMLVSDNFIAEQSLILCSGVQTDTLSVEQTIDKMKNTVLKNVPDKLRWADGSGLSRYNLFTPRSLVYILNEIRNKVPDQRLFNLFPNGGKTGTIRNFYKMETPFVFAKTGSLNGVHCLSGYLRTRKGKVLIFSFMHNNFIVPTSEVRNKMDEILRKLYYTY